MAPVLSNDRRQVVGTATKYLWLVNPFAVAKNYLDLIPSIACAQNAPVVYEKVKVSMRDHGSPLSWDTYFKDFVEVLDNNYQAAHEYREVGFVAVNNEATGLQSSSRGTKDKGKLNGDQNLCASICLSFWTLLVVWLRFLFWCALPWSGSSLLHQHK